MGPCGFGCSLMELQSCSSTQCVVTDGCLTGTLSSVEEEVFSEGWGRALLDKCFHHWTNGSSALKWPLRSCHSCHEGPFKAHYLRRNALMCKWRATSIRQGDGVAVFVNKIAVYYVKIHSMKRPQVNHQNVLMLVFDEEQCWKYLRHCPVTLRLINQSVNLMQLHL